MVELKPYPEYKPSKLQWLPSIPCHWNEKRAKYFFREVDERSTDGQEELLSVSHVTGVTPRRQKSVTMFMAESYAGHKLCRPGDLVINTMWAWMAAMGVSRHTGIVSPSYGVYRPLSGGELLPEYADTLLRTQPYRSEYICRSTGIRGSRLRLYPDKFLDTPITCPPISEQRQIVALLARSASYVRRFIRNRRHLIELLNEHKQVIIRDAITHGFKSTVRLRDSGVDWLGNVPEEWAIKRLKWVTRLQRGYDLPQDRRIPGRFPVVSSGGVIDTHSEARARGPGVVMGRYGSTDSVFFIDSDFWPHNTALFVTDFQGNDPRWCYYLLRTISKADHAGKSAVPGIDRKDLYDIYVARPPASEQANVIRELERRLCDVDGAVHRAQREIELVREYQTCLTADLVTGRLDVRHAAMDGGAHFPDADAGSEADEVLEEETLDPDELEAAEEVAIGDE